MTKSRWIILIVIILTALSAGIFSRYVRKDYKIVCFEFKNNSLLLKSRIIKSNGSVLLLKSNVIIDKLFLFDDIVGDPDLKFSRNPIIYDKKDKHFIFGEAFCGEDGKKSYIQCKNVLWKTIIIKMNGNNNGFNIIEQFDLKLCSPEDSYYSGISDDGNNLITNRGETVNISDEKTTNLFTGEKRFIYGANFINQSVFAIRDFGFTQKNKDPSSNDLDLVMYHPILKKLEVIYQSGKSFNQRKSYSFDNFKWINAKKSPDGKTIAFINPDDSLRISFFNSMDNSVNSGIIIRELTEKINYNNAYPIIEWSNNSSNGLLAEYDTFREYSSDISEDKKTEKTLKNSVIICDKNRKTVKDRIFLDYEVKSLRWSQDDKKLGILALEPTKNTDEPAATKGVLYIYDLDTKKLTKLMDCPDCFDFHFVE